MSFPKKIKIYLWRITLYGSKIFGRNVLRRTEENQALQIAIAKNKHCEKRVSLPNFAEESWEILVQKNNLLFVKMLKRDFHLDKYMLKNWPSAHCTVDILNTCTYKNP
jgi:hypothetical protein